MLSFIPQNHPSPAFPCMLPFPPHPPLPTALGMIPKSSPEHLSQHSPPKRKGEAGEKARQPVPCSHRQPLLHSCPAGLAAWALPSHIQSGLSNVKAVTQTSRKLKIKGEILYSNRTAPCFTKIWHRPEMNKWCCVTQIYMLHHLGKPQT